MKIKVSDLEANPFRKIKKYPLDQKKISDLKVSIGEEGFWGGIVVRKHGNKYQMAFGHHRLQAIKELNISEVDHCVVLDISDDGMLHKMFLENHETWGMRPACILENVESARDRLDEILEANSWESLGENTKWFEDEFVFLNIKGKGVGRTTILKYLGNLYNGNQVKDALAILSEPEDGISVSAAKQLPTLSHVRLFNGAVKKYKIPKTKHTGIAKQVAKEGVGRRGVEDIVAEHALPTIRKKAKLAARKSPPAIGHFIMDCEKDSDEFNRKLKGLLPVFDELSRSQIGRLVSSLKRLHSTIGTIINKSKGDTECQNRKTTTCITSG